MVGYHLAAILAGYLLDLCLGDPHSMPHPVRAIGNLIVWLEKYLRPAGKKHATERGERRAGVLFVCLVLLVTGSVAGAILWISRLGGIWIQTVVEAVMTYYLLAARSLRDESMAVCRKLEAGEIDTIGTDHCSFRFHGAKELGREDFSKIPNGIPGVE
ncbi:MAG: cobalamin biosynthesis protein CobD, partial [Clostridium sp.]|nr:cobalamin biosynthesis protein CobD [Clostridium sp.]